MTPAWRWRIFHRTGAVAQKLPLADARRPLKLSRRVDVLYKDIPKAYGSLSHAYYIVPRPLRYTSTLTLRRRCSFLTFLKGPPCNSVFVRLYASHVLPLRTECGICSPFRSVPVQSDLALVCRLLSACSHYDSGVDRILYSSGVLPNQNRCHGLGKTFIASESC